MVDPADMAERHTRILAELAELGMGLARQAAEDVAQAQTPEERGRAAMVFHRVSRSVRQSLALEARMVREAGRDAREQAAREVQAERRRISQREGEIREAVEALVWRETEDMDDDELDGFDAEMDSALWPELSSDTLFTDPLADQVGRVLGRLGFQLGPDGVYRRVSTRGCAPEPAPPVHGSG